MYRIDQHFCSAELARRDVFAVDEQIERRFQHKRREVNRRNCSVDIRHLYSRHVRGSEQQHVFKLDGERIDVVQREGGELTVQIHHEHVTGTRLAR